VNVDNSKTTNNGNGSFGIDNKKTFLTIVHSSNGWNFVSELCNAIKIIIFMTHSILYPFPLPPTTSTFTTTTAALMIILCLRKYLLGHGF
jgi:hypothetical protein